MNNSDFWASVSAVIQEGFKPEGLAKLDRYAEQFINRQLVYKRFSPSEQHGCAAGGSTHVIASLLAGAKAPSDSVASSIGKFKEELKYGKNQAEVIEAWAKAVGVWTDDVDQVLSHSLGEKIAEGGEAKVFDNGVTLVKSIGLEYFIQPILALDRISLHNTYFPETAMKVIGFGKDTEGDFKIVVEQPFIEGAAVSDDDIADYMLKMGFRLINPRNWTYATPSIYLSDIHDENVIKSSNGTIFIIDCDIRINISGLRAEGTRKLTTQISF